MKTFAAVSIAALLSAGCVVPVAGPPIYSPQPVYGRADVGNYPAPVYGRIDIGNYPPPVVYPQPVIISPPRYAVQQPPIYVRVPPEHHQQWHRHCEQYRACDRPVYFVREPAARAPGYAPAGMSRPEERDPRRWHHDDGGRAPAYRPLQPGDPRLR